MKIENLKRANELSQKINLLDDKLKSITEIKEQAGVWCDDYNILTNLQILGIIREKRRQQ